MKLEGGQARQGTLEIVPIAGNDDPPIGRAENRYHGRWHRIIEPATPRQLLPLRRTPAYRKISDPYNGAICDVVRVQEHQVIDVDGDPYLRDLDFHDHPGSVFILIRRPTRDRSYWLVAAIADDGSLGPIIRATIEPKLLPHTESIAAWRERTGRCVSA